MTAYLTFELRRAARNRRYVLFAVALPVVLYLVIGRQKASSVAGVDFAAYFMVSMAAYGAILGAGSVGGARVAAERSSGWVRQLRVTPLRSGSYLTSKVVLAVALAVPAILLVLVAGVATGVSFTAGTAVAVLAALVVASVPFALLGLAVGYWLDAEAAQTGGMAISLGLSILGGLWFPLSSFPRAVQYVGEALPTYRIASLARSVYTGHGVDWPDLAVLAAWTVGLALIFARQYRRDTDRSA